MKIDPVSARLERGEHRPSASRGHVLRSETPGDAHVAIDIHDEETALAEDSEERRDARRGAMQRETWDARFSEIVERLEHVA